MPLMKTLKSCGPYIYPCGIPADIANDKSWLRLSKVFDKSIVITQTFDPLFNLAFQDSIIDKKEFCMLWFFRKSVGI